MQHQPGSRQSNLFTCSINLLQHSTLAMVGLRKEIDSRSVQSKETRADVLLQTKIETSSERVDTYIVVIQLYECTRNLQPFFPAQI